MPQELLKPYEGSRPYIYISYAEENREEVLETAARLQKGGYRVWYGTHDGGAANRNNIRHLNGCKYFIAFISDEYVASERCCKELERARGGEKQRLAVFLGDVQLPPWLSMRLNRLQAIFKHKYADENEFYENLFAADQIITCHTVPGEEIGTAKSGGTLSGRKKLIAAAAGAAVIAAAVTAVLAGRSAEIPPEESGSAAEETQPDEFMGSWRFGMTADEVRSSGSFSAAEEKTSGDVTELICETDDFRGHPAKITASVDSGAGLYSVSYSIEGNYAGSLRSEARGKYGEPYVSAGAFQCWQAENGEYVTISLSEGDGAETVYSRRVRLKEELPEFSGLRFGMTADGIREKLGAEPEASCDYAVSYSGISFRERECAMVCDLSGGKLTAVSYYTDAGELEAMKEETGFRYGEPVRSEADVCVWYNALDGFYITAAPSSRGGAVCRYSLSGGIPSGEKYNIGSLRWGMTAEEAKAAETALFHDEETNENGIYSVDYRGAPLGGYSCEKILYFSGGKLYRVCCAVKGDIYDPLFNELTVLYGKPYKEDAESGGLYWKRAAGTEEDCCIVLRPPSEQNGQIWTSVLFFDIQVMNE